MIQFQKASISRFLWANPRDPRQIPRCGNKKKCPTWDEDKNGGKCPLPSRGLILVRSCALIEANYGTPNCVKTSQITLGDICFWFSLGLLEAVFFHLAVRGNFAFASVLHWSALRDSRGKAPAALCHPIRGKELGVANGKIRDSPRRLV